MDTNNSTYLTFKSTALELFKKYGVSRVTVEEICRNASISKVTFYKYFDNKIDLAKKIIIDIFERNIKKFDEIIHKDTGYEEKLKEIIDEKLRLTEEYGELFLTDMLYNEPELKAYIEELRLKSYKTTEIIYNLGISDGFIRESVTLEYFFYLIDIFSQMLQDEKFMKIFPEMKGRVEESIKLLFYGISKK